MRRETLWSPAAAAGRRSASSGGLGAATPQRAHGSSGRPRPGSLPRQPFSTAPPPAKTSMGLPPQLPTTPARRTPPSLVKTSASIDASPYARQKAVAAKPTAAVSHPPVPAPQLLQLSSLSRSEERQQPQQPQERPMQQLRTTPSSPALSARSEERASLPLQLVQIGEQIAELRGVLHANVGRLEAQQAHIRVECQLLRDRFLRFRANVTARRTKRYNRCLERLGQLEQSFGTEQVECLQMLQAVLSRMENGPTKPSRLPAQQQAPTAAQPANRQVGEQRPHGVIAAVVQQQPQRNPDPRSRSATLGLSAREAIGGASVRSAACALSPQQHEDDDGGTGKDSAGSGTQLPAAQVVLPARVQSAAGVVGGGLHTMQEPAHQCTEAIEKHERRSPTMLHISSSECTAKDVADVEQYPKVAGFARPAATGETSAEVSEVVDRFIHCVDVTDSKAVVSTSSSKAKNLEEALLMHSQEAFDVCPQPAPVAPCEVKRDAETRPAEDSRTPQAESRETAPPPLAAHSSTELLYGELTTCKGASAIALGGCGTTFGQPFPRNENPRESNSRQASICTTSDVSFVSDVSDVAEAAAQPKLHPAPLQRDPPSQVHSESEPADSYQSGKSCIEAARTARQAGSYMSQRCSQGSVQRTDKGPPLGGASSNSENHAIASSEPVMDSIAHEARRQCSDIAQEEVSKPFNLRLGERADGTERAARTTASLAEGAALAGAGTSPCDRGDARDGVFPNSSTQNISDASLPRDNGASTQQFTAVAEDSVDARLAPSRQDGLTSPLAGRTRKGSLEKGLSSPGGDAAAERACDAETTSGLVEAPATIAMQAVSASAPRVAALRSQTFPDVQLPEATGVMESAEACASPSSPGQTTSENAGAQGDHPGAARSDSKALADARSELESEKADSVVSVRTSEQPKIVDDVPTCIGTRIVPIEATKMEATIASALSESGESSSGEDSSSPEKPASHRSPHGEQGSTVLLEKGLSSPGGDAAAERACDVETTSGLVEAPDTFALQAAKARAPSVAALRSQTSPEVPLPEDTGVMETAEACAAPASQEQTTSVSTGAQGDCPGAATSDPKALADIRSESESEKADSVVSVRTPEQHKSVDDVPTSIATRADPAEATTKLEVMVASSLSESGESSSGEDSSSPEKPASQAAPSGEQGNKLMLTQMQPKQPQAEATAAALVLTAAQCEDVTIPASSLSCKHAAAGVDSFEEQQPLSQHSTGGHHESNDVPLDSQPAEIEVADAEIDGAADTVPGETTTADAENARSGVASNRGTATLPQAVTSEREEATGEAEHPRATTSPGAIEGKSFPECSGSDDREGKGRPLVIPEQAQLDRRALQEGRPSTTDALPRPPRQGDAEQSDESGSIVSDSGSEGGQSQVVAQGQTAQGAAGPGSGAVGSSSEAFSGQQLAVANDRSRSSSSSGDSSDGSSSNEVRQRGSCQAAAKGSEEPEGRQSNKAYAAPPPAAAKSQPPVPSAAGITTFVRRHTPSDDSSSSTSESDVSETFMRHAAASSSSSSEAD
eukprot:TRINITY_DN14770_c0_g1_i1.p1 TRINITY_DN14770_c0_g1~~TRINITY_DN14770_c0_g1_i1.p1  ORF type:complete len:1533 (+),score=312.83 TRINITY_DN14770_c0_g1_i1:112-4710(+)